MFWQGLVLLLLSAAEQPLASQRAPCAQAPEVTLPEAAFFINRDVDAVRAAHMRSALRAAGIRAVRIRATSAPRLEEGESVTAFDSQLSTGGEDMTRFAEQMLKQKRCAKLMAQRKGPGCSAQRPVACCVSRQLAKRTKCLHLSAYVPLKQQVKVANKTTSANCAALVANHLSKLTALRAMQKFLQRTRPQQGGAAAPQCANGTCPHRFVLLLEDDVHPFRDWTRRYCAFMERSPPSSWDAAKIEASRATTDWWAHFEAGGVCGHIGNVPGLALPTKAAPLSAEALVRLRSQRAKLSPAEQVRARFSMGMGAVLAEESGVAKLLAALEGAPLLSNDVVLAHAHCAQQIRFTVSDEPVFNAATPDQRRTSMGPGGHAV